MSNNGLFTACVFIWGSTWLAITFQLGEVDPAYSVGLRFFFAVVILGAFCLFKKLNLVFPLRVHLRMAAVGLCLYMLNYMFVYHSQFYLVSALVALLSSAIVYFNVVLRKVFFGKAINMEVVFGAAVGVIGLAFLFWKELKAFDAEQSMVLLGLALAFASFVSASFGNVIAENAFDIGAPVIQFNLFAMLYSLVYSFGYGYFSGAEFVLPTSTSYWVSLLYLSLFGSVLAFGAYMKLVKQMGADKSAYVVLMYPIVALILSTLYEGYEWHWTGFVGVLVVLLGNAIAMGKLKLSTFRLVKT